MPVPVVPDLAVFKAFFNRTKDWADLEEMAAAGTLDVDAVVGVLVRYLGADDQRDRPAAVTRRVDGLASGFRVGRQATSFGDVVVVQEPRHDRGRRHDQADDEEAGLVRAELFGRRGQVTRAGCGRRSPSPPRRCLRRRRSDVAC